MAAEVQDLSMVGIIKNSLKKTFSNWKTFLKFLLLPYLGVVFGILTAILPAFLASVPLGDNSPSGPAVLVSIILGALFGLSIFIYAFWIYIVRSAACYNIAKKMISEGVEKIEDSLEDSVNDITRRSGSYVKYLLWAALFALVIVIVTVAVLFLIFGKGMFATKGLVYYQSQTVSNILSFLLGLPLILSLAAFVFNPDLKPLNAIVKGVKLVIKNFLPSLGFYALSYAMIFTAIIAAILLYLVIVTLSALPPVIAVSLHLGAIAIGLSGIIAILLFVVAAFAMLAFGLIMGPPLHSMLLTHWYLRLEAKNTISEV